MSRTRSRTGWVVWVTFLIGLLLSVWPTLPFMEIFRPLWLALLLAFWTLHLPHKVGMTTAFVLGLAEDVLYGTLLGSLPGLAKELADARSPRGDASARDMAVNVVGAAIGAMLADCCLIRPIARNDRLDGVGVEYRIEF